MDDDESDTILCLIDEIKSEDHTTKLNAIKSLETIAQVIGQERTREELVPYTAELLDDDNEETLIAVALKLGDLSKYVGEPRHMVCLLAPLNTLACNEENNVREKAVQSLNLIAGRLPSKVIEEAYLPVLNSLAVNDWYSARIAACSLFSVIFPKLAPEQQGELVKLFVSLGKDDTPMVRRAAASNLGSLCSVVSHADLGRLLEGLSTDEHDSVRQAVLESVAKLVPKYKDLIQLVKKLAKDKSWRVRYTLVEHVQEYLEPFDSASSIVNEVVALINDSEPEVKCITLSNLSFVIQKLDKNSVEVYIMPSYEKLAKDPSQYVRLSLVQAICSTSCHFDVETAVQKLLPIIHTLIKDESFDVRISFADSMHKFNESIGPEKVVAYSVPLILQMMKDSQWRLRHKVVECLPQVADMIGAEAFNVSISESIASWLKDPVYAVREATLEAIKQISAMDGYGESWVKARILGFVQELAKEQIFTRRLTALYALNKFGNLIGGKEFYALVEVLASDSVANIRFNVAKTIRSNFGKIQGQNFSRILEKMKADPDPDVKFFSEEALKELNKKN